MIRSALSGGFYLITANLIQAAMGFGGNLVLLRALGPDEFGRFAVTLAGISLIVNILSMRLGILVLRASTDDFTPDAQCRYFSALIFESGAVAILSLAWLILAGRTTPFDFVLLVTVIVQNFAGQNRSFWERTMPYRRIALLETLAVAAGQVAGVATLLMTGNAVAIYVREAVAALASLAGLWAAGGLTLLRVRWIGVDEWRALAREARGVWSDSILEGVFQRLIILAVATFNSEHGAGVFYVAQRLAIAPHQVLFPLGRVALNWFGRIDDAADRRRWRDNLILLLALPLGLSAAIAVVFADTIVDQLFGTRWHEAAPVLIAMSGAIAFTSLFEITRGYSLIVGRSLILLAGRAAQFTGFSLPIVLVAVGVTTTPTLFGAGLSLAFAFAFLVQIFLLRRSENP